MGSDHFSALAGQYATFRPTYPDALFDWLARIAPQRELAWDCGAGSGQATRALAARFAQVLASDLSATQLAAAPSLPNVHYRVADAADSALPDHSADLITVAQALHWFDLPRFHAEARRVLRPRGIIAVWGYNRLRIAQHDVQRIVDRYYDTTIAAYWPRERTHVENAYRDLDFPYARIDAPAFALHKTWTRAHLLGYLRSWSATGHFTRMQGYDPVAALEPELAACWPDDKRHRIAWPLFLHVGRVD